MAHISTLIALTLSRAQLLSLITQSGLSKIQYERKTTNTLRRFVIDLICQAASTDETTN